MKIVFLDLETATLPDEVLENISLIAQIGYVYADIDDKGNVKILEYGEEFTKPDMKIVPSATRVNNISNVEVGLVPGPDGKYEEVPHINDSKIFKRVKEILSDKEVFVGGHYLENERKLFEKIGYKMDNPQFDTMKIAERIFFNQFDDMNLRPDSLNLQFLRGFVADTFNLEGFIYSRKKEMFKDYAKHNQHQALYDAFDSLILAMAMQEADIADFKEQARISQPEKYLLTYVSRVPVLKENKYVQLDVKDLFNMFSKFETNPDINFTVKKTLQKVHGINLDLINTDDTLLFGQYAGNSVTDIVARHKDYAEFVILKTSINLNEKSKVIAEYLNQYGLKELLSKADNKQKSVLRAEMERIKTLKPELFNEKIKPAMNKYKKQMSFKGPGD